jgi:hypothetical protein
VQQGPSNAVQDLIGGQIETDQFIFEVDDGNGGTDTATVDVTVNGEDDSFSNLVLFDFDDGFNIGTYPGAHGTTHKGFDFYFSQSPYATYAGFNNRNYNGNDSDLETITYYAPKLLEISQTNGDEFDFVSADLADGVSANTNTNQQANTLEVRGYNNGVELYSKIVTLNDSQLIATDFSFYSIDELAIEVTGGTYTTGQYPYQSGWWSVDDLSFLI